MQPAEHSSPRRRPVPWIRPTRPELARLVAAPQLAVGAVLLSATLVLMPPAIWPAPAWSLAVLLAVHAVLVWAIPIRTWAGDLLAVAAGGTALVAIVASCVLIGNALHAWAILLGLPVLYASSMFGRAVAAATTAGSCVAGIVVLFGVVAGRDAEPELVVDVLLICGCLGLLAAVVVHGMEHITALVAELERVAAVDGLTGLVTRRVLDDALAASLSTARSATGTALVLVDLDHFKSVNDVHGHPVGDAVLQHVATVLTAAVRSTDAVVSRLGGDELAVLLPGCPVEVARTRADDLVRAVRENPLVLADGTALHLTVSVGVAHAPEHAADVRSLYATADAALYAAKRAGRDGYAVAGSSLPVG